MKTTREEAKEESHDEVVKNLNELLEKNYDAEKGFKKALEDVKNPSLKKFFKKQVVIRNRFKTEIEKELHDLNAHPKIKEGSATGSIHRVWIDIKTALSGNDDEAVLEECIRGEKASAKEYEEKLSKGYFSPNVKKMLTSQLHEIKNTISSVKRLEDIADD
ncbi:ferritin-like domain-containing protein [Gillisia sp. JM1]|uniref:ferritin-like domain-containing protein n=1 Tax=Gillisia sp. JM1 TaxID=1283286 RepID=UPI00040AD608|nr:PA2169 family four-helix-bundle protein [Gillisia sp. JM1]